VTILILFRQEFYFFYFLFFSHVLISLYITCSSEVFLSEMQTQMMNSNVMSPLSSGKHFYPLPKLIVKQHIIMKAKALFCSPVCSCSYRKEAQSKFIKFLGEDFAAYVNRMSDGCSFEDVMSIVDFSSIFAKRK